MARTTAWSVAVNAASRGALMADPAWPDGEVTRGWDGWVAVMQVLAGRTPAALEADGTEPSAVPAMLAERAQAMRDSGAQAVDWVWQTYAYDAHDVATTPGCDGTLAGALARIEAATLVLAADNDLYNPISAARAAAAAITGARYVEIPSPEGHMAASFRRPRDVAFIDRTMQAFFSAPR